MSKLTNSRSDKKNSILFQVPIRIMDMYPTMPPDLVRPSEGTPPAPGGRMSKLYYHLYLLQQRPIPKWLILHADKTHKK